jgi:uroporphyrinogen III methyltransferase / synthase
VRIVLTRPRRDARALAERLERLGHEVLLCPLIRVEPLSDEPIDTSAYDWVVVTSRNGARELVRRRTGRLTRLAAIGPGTGEELEAAGLSPDLVPAVSTQEGLLAVLPQPAGRVLFAAAAGARRLLPEQLGADFVPLYRTVPVEPGTFPEADLVVLASASAARAYGHVSRGAPAVSIGPETTKAARAAGVAIAAEAATHDAAGLVAAIDALH